jgi:NAD(P)-dependent dehydrogenase (short-subunit alcohol dehydrogenase family)
LSTFAADALAGRSILITGASSGLGRAAALAVASCGGRVIAGGRDAGRLEETLAQLDGDGHIAIPGPLDDADQASALMTDAAAQAGGLDGVFHAAGAVVVLPVRLIKQKHIDEVFGAAVQGALGIARAAAKAEVMKANASIIFMSSAAAHRGRSGLAAYSAAKAAVEGLTRSLAVELAPKAIRVNAIASGAIETEMHARVIRPLSEEAVAEYAGLHPLGIGKPEDVANAALFLLSDAASYITGATLAVDGGYLGS